MPMVIALRFALGLPFRWKILPFFVAAYFGGQFAVFVVQFDQGLDVLGNEGDRHDHSADAVPPGWHLGIVEAEFHGPVD